jgi:transcriptional regulator with XRE-family HTH domain
MELTDALRKGVVARIKYFREHSVDGTPRARPLTQRELAARVGVSHTTIANVENEKQFASLEAVYRICLALGLELEQLLPSLSDVAASSETKPQHGTGKDQTVEVGGVSHELPEEWASVIRSSVGEE